MEPIDAHYTPNALAMDLVEIGAQHCRCAPSIVADFAAGEGGLLDAAALKWADAQIVANDAHRPTSLRLRRMRPEWSVANTNFVDRHSVRRSKLVKLGSSVDLALLNPPFSQKRSDLHRASVGGIEVTCGLAAAFVARSLDFIRIGGAISSILPDGCLSAERDREVWRLIRDRCDVRIEAKNLRGTFPNAYPSTSIVSVIKREDTESRSFIEADEPCFELDIVRGWKPMHLIDSSHREFEQFPLVHTTALQYGRVRLAGACLVGSPSYFQGPALLIPRVGKMTKEKICVLTTRRKVVLSDCVIGVQFQSVSAAEAAKKMLIDAWPEVESCYSGTGAPYTTISTIRRLFRKLKVVASD